MRAIVFTEYGPPEVLQLKELPKPKPKEDEVLIRIYATTVTTAGIAALRGKPLISRLFTGITKPNHPILGVELAGEIEAVGAGVPRLRAGDQVFASTSYGTLCEYICLPENAPVVLKPPSMTHEQAAAVVDGAHTALYFLRDMGNIQSGSRVLVNGASGSIGTFAVQLARYFGAQVSGVCSTRNLELVKSLGADAVFDYTAEDFTKSGETYDIIFDTVNKSSFSRCKTALTPDGIYLTTYPTAAIMLQMAWNSLARGKKAAVGFAGVRPDSEKTENLHFLRELIEGGSLRSVIDRTYPLEQASEAYHYVAKGHKVGNVVITIQQS
jgi:NADPH:quinone reductase-like Zn-dependent oxidoreductase